MDTKKKRKLFKTKKPPKENRYKGTLALYNAIQQVLWIGWPLFLLIPAYLPGAITDASRGLLIAAAVLWVVVWIIVTIMWFANRDKKYIPTWVYALMVTFTLLTFLFMVIALTTGQIPCPVSAPSTPTTATPEP